MFKDLYLGGLLSLCLIFTINAADNGKDYTTFTHPMITDVKDWDKNKQDLKKINSFLALTDDQLRACVPYQAPRLYSLCPSCSKKVNGRDFKRRHYPSGIFDFDPKKPNKITCSTCKESFPDNPRYPQTKTKLFQAPIMWADLNENAKVKVRWHEQVRPSQDPSKLKPGQDGKWIAYFYMDGALDTRRDVFCQDLMSTLTKAYYYYTHNKDDKNPELAYKCAWKVSVILDEYANALPRWLLCDNYGKDYFNCGSKGPFPYGWSETRYGTARQTSEQHGPGFFRHSLDILAESKTFKDYGKNHKPSDYEHLFAKFGEKAPEKYTLTFYEKLCRNALIPVRRYQGEVLGKWGQGCPINGTQDYARLIHNREMLRLAAQSMFVFPQKSFFVDAGYSEGSGYSGIHLLHTHKGLFQQVGYTDPYDYKIPADSPNRAKWEKWFLPEDMPYMGLIKDYRPVRPNKDMKYQKFWKQAFSVWKDLTTPNGGQFSLAEDGHRNLGSYRHVMSEPKHITGHVLKTGMKRFLLGDGEGDDQVQLNLNAGLYTAHGRSSFLDLQIFDNGHYLADGFGYGKHQMRSRYNSLQAMNSGGYDTYQKPSSNGTPWIYESNIPGVALARVGTHRETEAMEKFERTVALISTDIKHPYIIDLFYMKGQGNEGKGKRREYFFHSSKHHEQTSKVSLSMKKLPGERGMLTLEGQQWNEKMLNSKGYGVFFDAHEGDASSNFTVDFDVVDPWKPLMWKFDPKRSSVETEIKGKTPNSALPFKAKDDSYADKPAIGLRRHIVGSAGMKAYKYNMPHPQKLHKNTHSNGWGRMPGFLLRHDVKDTSEDSEFLVVHEAWQKTPYIKSVKRLPKENGSENAIALEITMPNRTDIVILSNDQNEATYEGNGISFKGRFGIIAKAGNKTDAALIGGTQLTGKGVYYKLPKAAYTGTINSSERQWRGQENGFYIDTELPNSLIGSWMMVNVKGKSIKRHEKAENLDKITGAGWAFKIAGIKKKNGKTFVLTEKEHGLEIKPTDCREFFKPHSHIQGAATFQIYPHLSNQGLVKLSNEGGPQAGPTQVKMKSLAGISGAKIQYLIVPLNAEPIYSVDNKKLKWQTYNGPVTIDSDCRLLVRSIAANGIKTPVAQRYEFTMPPKQAVIADVTKLKSKPVFFSESSNGENSNILSPLVRLPYALKNDTNRGHNINSLGLLKIEQAGQYSFFYHSKHIGELTIGETVLFRGDEPSGEMATVFLKPGFYDFSFTCKSSNQFDLEWQALGQQWQKLTHQNLFHRPVTFEQAMLRFKTQKAMR